MIWLIAYIVGGLFWLPVIGRWAYRDFSSSAVGLELMVLTLLITLMWPLMMFPAFWEIGQPWLMEHVFPRISGRLSGFPPFRWAKEIRLGKRVKKAIYGAK